MGHTHYNEIANEGPTLYSATRSTGQIEEGPLGYSVTSIDGEVVSWRFVELGKLPVVLVTSPRDERLLTKSNEPLQATFKVRAKFWGETHAVRATADMEGQRLLMRRIADSQVWEVEMAAPGEGTHALTVSVEDANGRTATDEVHVAIGESAQKARAIRDQDNALLAWPEHGLIGTQLGPNKNGKK